MAQQAKEQADEEIKRLKNVIKTKLGKMDTPTIPYQDVKPLMSGQPTTKGTTKFSYTDTAPNKVGNLGGTTWVNKKPSGDATATEDWILTLMASW